MKLSDKIRIIRKARGFSQETLGEKLSRTSQYGISRQSISDWENGKTEPKLENIRDLTEVLQVSFDSLLDESIDLNDPDVLTGVLQISKVARKTEVDSSFRYILYANNLSARSFVCCIIFACLIILTGLCLGLGLGLEIGVFNIIAIVCPAISLGVLPSAIIEIIRALRGKVCCYMGELNQSHIILKTYLTAENTLVIPIEKITKMELGKKQKRLYGEVVISIENRPRPVTLIEVMNPMKLIEAYKKISSYNCDTDCVKIF
ncbi:MAG: helix-turn-helix domain-containing protein [Christensenellales bacterium]